MDAVVGLATPTGQWPEAIHPHTRGVWLQEGSPVLFGRAPTCFGPVSITLNPLSDTNIEIVLQRGACGAPRAGQKKRGVDEMKFIRAIGFCRCCREDVLVLRRVPLHGLHLLLSGLTAGLWVVFWLRSTLQSRAWRCSQCSRVVLNGAITPLSAQAEPPVRPAGRRLDPGPSAAPGSFNHKLVFQGLVYYMPTGSPLH